MAVVARVGRVLAPQRDRQVGARHPERVVVPLVHHHVRLVAHVARDAGGAGALLAMEVMAARGERLGPVALGAHLVAPGPKPRGVRVVAVRAGDPGVVHAALQERAPVVDLVPHLPVGVVEARVEERRLVRLGERAARPVILGQQPAPRVAPPARLHLDAPVGDVVQPDRPARLVHRGGPIATVVEAHHQPRVPEGRAAARGRRLRPLDVARPGAVARFARDVDLGERGREAVLRRERSPCAGSSSGTPRTGCSSSATAGSSAARRRGRSSRPGRGGRSAGPRPPSAGCPRRSPAPAGGLRAAPAGTARAASRRTRTPPRTRPAGRPDRPCGRGNGRRGGRSASRRPGARRSGPRSRPAPCFSSGFCIARS